MTPRYNLIDEPWLPCIRPSGDVEYVGILDALTRAGEYKELRDESPLVTAALHRMLLAVLHRVFGPESEDEWGDIWRGGRGAFDRAKLENYLKSSALFDRFDLFDGRHPFYQCASLPLGPVDKKTGRPKYVKPIWQLAHEIAYSDNLSHFCHPPAELDDRSPAEAARWLVAFQAFALGGLITFLEGEGRKTEGSADAGQLVKSAVVLARGDNVFQTLMLNLVAYSREDERPFATKNGDKPAWERDKETAAGDRQYDGYLDLLTWQSRRVKLVPKFGSADGSVRVDGVVALKGYQLPDGYHRVKRETMAGFRKRDKPKPGEDPWPVLGFHPSKALWRDSHTLLQQAAEQTERPQVLSWVGDLKAVRKIERSAVRLECFGMSADRAKVFHWRHESLPLPLTYLESPPLVASLRQALELAEAVAREALRPAVWAAVSNRLTGSEGGSPDTDRVRAVVDSLGTDRHYWSQLELPFREFLVSLASDVEGRDARVARWLSETLDRMARSVFAETVERLDAGRDLKAVNAGRGVLNSRLAEIAADARKRLTPGGAS